MQSPGSVLEDGGIATEMISPPPKHLPREILLIQGTCVREYFLREMLLRRGIENNGGVDETSCCLLDADPRWK